MTVPLLPALTPYGRFRHFCVCRASLARRQDDQPGARRPACALKHHCGLSKIGLTSWGSTDLCHCPSGGLADRHAGECAELEEEVPVYPLVEACREPSGADCFALGAGRARVRQTRRVSTTSRMSATALPGAPDRFRGSSKHGALPCHKNALG